MEGVYDRSSIVVESKKTSCFEEEVKGRDCSREMDIATVCARRLSPDGNRDCRSDGR